MRNNQVNFNLSKMVEDLQSLLGGEINDSYV